MAVATSRLAVAGTAPPAVEHTIYTASPGETVIVKDIHAYNEGDVVSRGVVWVQSGARRVTLIDRSWPINHAEALSCWVVLLPGDQIGCYSADGNVNLWVSGTELEGLAD